MVVAFLNASLGCISRNVAGCELSLLWFESEWSVYEGTYY